MRPDLNKPYSTRQEREESREAIINYWRLIEFMMSLADVPADKWNAGMRGLLPDSVPGGPTEHPLQRLERWLSLYNEEVQILRDVRNRIIHAIPLEDVDIRGAEWVARVILATLFGTNPSQINKNWARLESDNVSRQIR
jgi:hypothetical protein